MSHEQYKNTSIQEFLSFDKEKREIIVTYLLSKSKIHVFISTAREPMKSLVKYVIVGIQKNHSINLNNPINISNEEFKVCFSPEQKHIESFGILDASVNYYGHLITQTPDGEKNKKIRQLSYDKVRAMKHSFTVLSAPDKKMIQWKDEVFSPICVKKIGINNGDTCFVLQTTFLDKKTFRVHSVLPSVTKKQFRDAIVKRIDTKNPEIKKSEKQWIVIHSFNRLHDIIASSVVNYSDTVERISPENTTNIIQRFENPQIPTKNKEPDNQADKILATGGTINSALKKGIEIEKEHKDLYIELKKRLEEEGAKMPFTETEFFTWIAKAHLREKEDYYDLLKKYVENENMKKEIKAPSGNFYAKVKPIREGAPELTVRVSTDEVGDFIAGYQIYHPAKSTKKVAYFPKATFLLMLEQNEYTIIPKEDVKFENGGGVIKINDNIFFNLVNSNKSPNAEESKIRPTKENLKNSLKLAGLTGITYDEYQETYRGVTYIDGYELIIFGQIAPHSTGSTKKYKYEFLLVVKDTEKTYGYHLSNLSFKSSEQIFRSSPDDFVTNDETLLKRVVAAFKKTIQNKTEKEEVKFEKGGATDGDIVVYAVFGGYLQNGSIYAPYPNINTDWNTDLKEVEKTYNSASEKDFDLTEVKDWARDGMLFFEINKALVPKRVFNKTKDYQEILEAIDYEIEHVKERAIYVDGEKVPKKELDMELNQFKSGGTVSSRKEFLNKLGIGTTTSFSNHYKEWLDGSKEALEPTDGKYIGYQINDNTVTLIFEKGTTEFEFNDGKFSPIKTKSVHYKTGGRVGGFEYKTVNTSTEKGLKEAEKLKEEGWKIISTGFETIQFERPKKYKDGGDVSEGVDLFEDYENIPKNVKKVLDKYSEGFEDGNYDELAKANSELKKIGYTFDYYLDGQAYDLRKIGQKGKSELDSDKLDSKPFAEGGEITAKYIGEDDWSRKLYKGTNGKTYADVDGELYHITDDGEPLYPARNVKKSGEEPKDDYFERAMEAKRKEFPDMFEKGGEVLETNDTKYWTTRFTNKGNEYSVGFAWGKYNHISVSKLTNNPFRTLGKEFKNIDEAISHYKDANIRTQLIFAENLAKEKGYVPKFERGGVIAKGTMNTPDGEIEGKVVYNDYWKKYQVNIDGTIYEEFRTPEEAISNLEGAGFKNVQKFERGGGVASQPSSGGSGKNTATVLIISNKNPLSTQLEKITGKTYNAVDFSNEEDNLIREDSTGRLFVIFTLNYFAQVDKYVIDDDLSYIKHVYGVTNFYWPRKTTFEQGGQIADEIEKVIRDLEQTSKDIEKGYTARGFNLHVRLENSRYTIGKILKTNQSEDLESAYSDIVSAQSEFQDKDFKSTNLSVKSAIEKLRAIKKFEQGGLVDGELENETINGLKVTRYENSPSPNKTLVRVQGNNGSETNIMGIVYPTIKYPNKVTNLEAVAEFKNKFEIA